MKISKPRLLIALLSGTCLLQLACSNSSSSTRRYENFPVYPVNEKAPQKLAERLPWEVWAYTRDLNGEPLKSAAMIRGDEQFRVGNYEKAIEEYRALKEKELSPAENEALVIRLAGAQLALGQSDRALGTVSSYFRANNKDINSVDARFSLLFAYAYGQGKDFDQSLAWFSRVHQVAAGRGGMEESADKGVRLLLRSVEAEKVDALDKGWLADAWVSSLIGQERRRRASGGMPIAGAWWALNLADADSNLTAQSGPVTLGVLLPLSGQYATLGVSVKNGIELAVDSQNGPTDPTQAPVPALTKLAFKDSTSDSMQTVTGIKELAFSDGAGVVIGPLLSDPAVAAAEIAKRNRLPMITFSKRNTFPTGDGVFRLGLTASSQVVSLLDRAVKAFDLKKFAILYPDDSNGLEFAQVFREELRIRGLELFIDKSYAKDNYDSFVELADEIEKSGVQAVFLPDSLIAASRFISNLPAKSKQNIKFLGTANWDNQSELLQSRAVLDGVVFVSPFFIGETNPNAQKFIDLYKSKYNQTPDFLAAQGFDVATMVLSAVKRQQSDAELTFLQALYEIDAYDGLTGMVHVESNGEMQRRLATVEWRDGKSVEIIEPVNVNPSYIMHGNEIQVPDSPSAQDGVAKSDPTLGKK